MIRIILVLVLLVLASAGSAQEVVYDYQVKAGPLMTFPSARDETKYYYSATRARLARHDNGLPMFSFIRFSEENKEGGEEAEGGGLIHAVVELGVTDEDIQNAERELRRQVPGAELVGPVAFKSGQFALVTSAADPGEDSEIAKKVVGVGRAPVLQGDRAAVSILLTPYGANVLWASFNTATPDISFNFEMEIDAYRAPIEAEVVAKWDSVYNHQSFAAALQGGSYGDTANMMLGVDIEASFEELKNSGGIKILSIGTGEAEDRVLDAFYESLRGVMFEPANMSGGQSLAPETRQSAYDRASDLLSKAEEDRNVRNQQRRDDRSDAIDNQAGAAGSSSEAAGLEQSVEISQSRADRLETQRDEAEQEYLEFQQAHDRKRSSGGYPNEEAEQIAHEMTRRLMNRYNSYRREAEQARQDVVTQRESLTQSRARADEEKERARLTEDDVDQEEISMAIAVTASFRIKQVKRSGEYRLNMKKYKAEQFGLRFDAPIGDLRRYLNNEAVFVERQLDPMAFRQREIVVDVSNLSTEDFGSYLSSAVVQMRKQHESSRTTTDEVRVASDTISSENADFKLVYVSDGDRDPVRFDNYEYRVSWRFDGGREEVTEWASRSQEDIGLTPPLMTKPVYVELDPDKVEELGIRSVTVRLFSLAEGASKPIEIRLRPSSVATDFSTTAYVLMPYNGFEYAYEVIWNLNSGDVVQSGRQTTSNTDLWVSDLPTS